MPDHLTPTAERIVADIDHLRRIDARQPVLNRTIVTAVVLMAMALALVAVRSETRTSTLEELGSARDRDITAIREEMKTVCRAVPIGGLAPAERDACNRAERGEPPVPRDGVDGVSGRGVANTAIVAGRLLIAYTDGVTEDKGPVVGQPGAEGAPGRGVVGTAVVSGRLVLSYSDNTTEDVGPVVGPKGEPGRSVAGVDAIGGRLIVTYDDGTTQDAGPLPPGPPGRGIARTEVVACRWQVTYTDGAVEDAGNACTTGTETVSPTTTAVTTTDGPPPLLPLPTR